METYSSETNEFFRVKECVRINLIRRLDSRRIHVLELDLETLHREVCLMAERLLEDQHTHDLPPAEQRRLIDEVADEISAAGISGLSESLWEQPSDLQFRVTKAAIPVLLLSFAAVWFCPRDLTFSLLATALVSLLTLTVFTALILLIPDSSIRLLKAQRK